MKQDVRVAAGGFDGHGGGIGGNRHFELGSLGRGRLHGRWSTAAWPQTTAAIYVRFGALAMH